MSLDRALFGQKVRLYREQFALSISNVADATGIPQDTLLAFEAGTGLPTGDQVLVLADYYKCDYRGLISNERIVPLEQTARLFRRYGRELSQSDRWAIQEFIFLAECEQFLLEALGRLQPERRFSYVKSGSYKKAQGVAAARALRKHLNYAPNEVVNDVYRDLRDIGIHVFRRRLANSAISGLFVRHGVAGMCVLINYDEDTYRQRFTAAHEAGHALLDEDDEVISFTGPHNTNLSEVRANAFASEYLLPRELLASIADPKTLTPSEAAAIASKLRVSTAALSIALQSAFGLNDEDAQRLRSVRVAHAEKGDPELPDSLSPATRERRRALMARGLSNFYVSLCFEALLQERISLARAAEMLLVSENEALELADLYGVRLVT